MSLYIILGAIKDLAAHQTTLTGENGQDQPEVIIYNGLN